MNMTEDGAPLGESPEVVGQFPPKIDLATFAKVVSRTAHEHGWWENGDRNMGEMIALMHAELSEGLEAWRDREPDLWYRHNLGPTFLHGPNEFSRPDDDTSRTAEFRGILGKPCGLATEFADTIIRILDTCETLNIPIMEALVRKAAYNETRPYRHGGKLA